MREGIQGNPWIVVAYWGVMSVAFRKPYFKSYSTRSQLLMKSEALIKISGRFFLQLNGEN